MGWPRAAVLLGVLLSGVILGGAPAAADNDHPDIAGGYEPALGAWPWVTALVDLTRTASSGDMGHTICTATLIAPDRVLTAAHCVVGPDRRTPRPANTFQVLVGRRDLVNTTEGVRRNVVGVAVHPKVSLPLSGVQKNYAFYDVAVLLLDSPVTTIPPAPIGLSTDWAATATAMGFGHSNYDHVHPIEARYLRAADFDTWSDAACASWMDLPAGAQHYYSGIHICVNNSPGTAVDCITHGDSGGPLMVRRPSDGTWQLIGVTSFYPQGGATRADRCGAGGPFGFAWIAGEEMRDWPLTVPITRIADGTLGPVPVRPLTISFGEISGYARYMIRHRTNGQVRGLKRTCERRTTARIDCRLQWHIKKTRYSGRARFYVYAESSRVFWDYAFRGTKKSPGKAPRRVIW